MKLRHYSALILAVYFLGFLVNDYATAAPVSVNSVGTQTDSNGDPYGTLMNIELTRDSSGSIHAAPSVVTHNFLVIIDAGSSHTKLYVYKWPSAKIKGTGIVVEESNMDCKTILSNFKNQPEEAGPSLRECLNFAAMQVPQEIWRVTRVLLGATAGMRVLSASNETIAKAIMLSVSDYVGKRYQFVVEARNIAILSPENEGAFSWVSVNFAKGILKENANAEVEPSTRQPTWGSLDVGGASTQFSVEVIQTKVAPSFCVKSFGQEYKIYTKSFLCYGKNEAYRRYKALLIRSHNFTEPIVDPCRPAQFDTVVQFNDHFAKPCSNVTVADVHYKEKFVITGGADGDRCHDHVQELFRHTMDLNPSACPFQDGDCSFARIKKGTVRAKFLGTGALYYDTKNLRILSNDSFSLSPFDAAGFRAGVMRYTVFHSIYSISMLIEQLIAAKPELKNFFIRHCFDATYEEVLLSSVYGLDDETLKEMIFSDNVNGIHIGWTLGWAVIMSTDDNCVGGWDLGRGGWKSLNSTTSTSSTTQTTTASTSSYVEQTTIITEAASAVTATTVL
uniref:Putative ectonucleoside triphosphate diphosphohydrolase 2 n=1 Tax=Hypsibius dujardini TaxID=232323 RepID=A0A0U2JTH3_HYPDU|nr:putative ectonucleoside triphosphate diphosphohydrolase 2 [Hypsibius dujardini]